MRIITLNANGIRAAERKGVYPWLKRQKADVVCIQETKAQLHQLESKKAFFPTRHCYYHDAEKKGYSGVALYCAVEPDNIQVGVGLDWFDAEGRWLQADFGKLSVISLYLPSGSSKQERQEAKYESMDWLMPHLRKLAGDGREYVICGDWNIAHTNKDLKNWRGNQKNSGFLPQERAWLDELFNSAGWVDTFRQLDDRDEQYTWWSNRGQAWANNTGWRIDYQIATPGIASKAVSSAIYKRKRFSDHAPLTIDYNW